MYKTKKNGKCHYFIQILVGCSFSVLPSDLFADILALEMPIYNFSGKHTVENIFQRCSLTSHPKHFHGCKANFRRIQEAVSLPFHWLAWTISVVMNKGFYRLCWGRGGYCKDRHRLEQKSGLVQIQASLKGCLLSCLLLYASIASTSWYPTFSLYDASIFSLYWIPPLFSALEPNYK